MTETYEAYLKVDAVTLADLLCKAVAKNDKLWNLAQDLRAALWEIQGKEDPKEDEQRLHSR